MWYLVFDRERLAKTRKPGKFKEQRGDKCACNRVSKSDWSKKMEVISEGRVKGADHGALWETERNLFFSPNFIAVLLTNKNCIYLKCTTWWFDISIHCEMITYNQTNKHIHHLTYLPICVCVCVCVWWEHLRSTLLANFK